MPRRDPNENNEGFRFPKCGVGRRLLHAVGFRRWEARSGTPMLEIHFCCVRDFTGSGEEGYTARRGFATTDAALPFLDRAVMAIGWNEPYDPDDDDDIEKIISLGPVVAILKQDGQYTEIDALLPWNGPVEPKWEKIIDNGEKQFQSLMAYLEREGQGGGRTARRKPAEDVDPTKDHGSGSGGGGQDDDIPFRLAHAA